ncbi:MAG: PD40 domain-containing protein [Bacteroidetes bacterium]|nr:PD40 domain-containing protein [Bacteroidota bacterium]
MLRISYLQLVILFLFLSVLSAVGQTKGKKEMEEDAYNALNDEDYVTAYEKFDALNSKYPTEIDYKLKLGICCLRNPERKERAIEIFTEIKKDNPKFYDSDYYLGKAYHVNYKFDESIALLETYLKERSSSINKEDKINVEDAKLTITYCNNGKLLIKNKVIADIKNMGSPINSEDEQYVPVITTDESILFFTYSGKFSIGGKLNEKMEPDKVEGKYLEDVYISYRRPDGLYTEPQGIDAINTKGNDAAIAISPDGQCLFTFYSDANNSGDIQMSKLVGDEFSKPVFLNKNINTSDWEGSCSISADGRFLYFASERPGGLGGRDIWVSEKVDGDWGPAKNMGPIINTPYDDDDPFIHPDGITMFLSSKGHSSIGGYDIMFSIKEVNEWTTPQSMGMPLNSTEDDRYYVINSKGDRGYFSSNRSSSGGKGKSDIYTVMPGILGKKPVIALLKGTVYGNDQPLEAKIEIIRTIKKDQYSKEELEMLSANEINADGKLVMGTYYSNSSTGKYLTTLNPGAIYRIRVSADKYESVEEDVDIENLQEYMETTKDFYLVSTQTAVATNPTVAVTPTVAVITPTITETPTVATTTSPCSDKTLPDFAPLKGKSLNDITYYKQLLAMAGDYCAGNMIFKVQIGAYRKPENFKYPNLQTFGKAEVVNYPDGITRFTQKEFKTLKEAEVQRQKAIAKGQTDAWIVGFIDGKRYTLEDLIMLDFLGKTIN